MKGVAFVVLTTTLLVGLTETHDIETHHVDHPFGLLATFQESGGWWRIVDHNVQCGILNDIPIAADYFNEGTKRIAVWRPSNGVWYIKGRGYNNWGATAGNIAIQCGIGEDVPVPGDYKGDGKLSIAVWRPSNGNWYIKGPGTASWGSSSGNLAIQCGMRGDVPVAMDYFKEGKLRLAVWRPSNGVWYIKGDNLVLNWHQSKHNIAMQCGQLGDVPIPGDYYGDGQIRLAVWRPSNGMWYIKGEGIASWAYSSGNVQVQCGMHGDIPVPYDYFNEGKLRIAVYRPSNGVWYIKGDGLANWGSTVGNILVYGQAPHGNRQQPVNLIEY